MTIALNGPIRLIMLRSGKYDYAEVEMDVPVHLVGPNNVGKTSLIAALQFLYIDEQRQMHFSRGLDETRRYYFPDPNSYILFECRTPSGFQVLGGHGLGPLKGYDFERFGYQGRFEKEDFIGPGRHILEADRIRANLSVKGYTRLEPRHLRAALTGIGDSKGVHLGLVPLKNRDHYNRFRSVFKNLLRLSHLRQDELKALILDIYRGDFQQVEIDLERLFTDLYSRVKTDAYELQELRGLEEHIRLLAEQHAKRQRLQGRLPTIWETVQKKFLERQDAFEAKMRELEARLEAFSRDREETRNAKKELEKSRREITGRLAVLKEQLRQIESDREKFSDFIPEWAEQQRSSLQKEVEKTGQKLLGASSEPETQVERRINAHKREIASLERNIEGLEKTLSARMRKEFSEGDLDRLFRLLNPELLGLSEGEGEEISVHDPQKASGQVRAILCRAGEDFFRGDGFSLRLTALTPPDLARYSDPEAIKARMQEIKLLLGRDQDLLDASRRAEELKKLQAEKRRELHRIIATLEAFRAFEKRLENAGKWQEEASELQKRENELSARIEELDEHLQTLVVRQQEASSLMEDAKKERQRLIRRLQELSPPKDGWKAGEQADFPEDIEDLVRIYKREYQEEERLGNEVARGLQLIEQRTYGRYPAADEAAAISRLLEEVEGLEEKQRAVEKLWTSIAVGLRSSFKGLARDLDALKGRVGQVNRALKEEQRAGAGRRVVAKAKEALADFAEKLFPMDFGKEGKGTFDACPSFPRMEAVLCRRDAKAAGSTWAQPVLLRGFGSARLLSHGPGGDPFPVAALTRLAGLAALRLERPFRWAFDGRMAVVENLEVFLSFERLGLDTELVLYSGGRLSRLVLAWLSSDVMAGTTVLHLGDYDPVGLSEYLRVKEAIRERAGLYVPRGIKGLIKRFGKASLVTGQTGTLARLRACGHQDVERLAELLEECGCGLEQEVLLHHFSARA